MPAHPVEVEKVDHVAVHQAVNHIADGTAQNAGHGKGEQFLSGVRLEHPHNQARCRNTNNGKEPTLPAPGAGQKREGGAAVVHPYQVEETGYGRAVAQVVIANDQDLGELVGDQDDQGQPQPLQHAAARAAQADGGFG